MQILLRNGQKLMGLDNIVKIRVKMFDTLFISNINIEGRICKIILNIVFVLINLFKFRHLRVFISQFF